ncbi:MAG: PAS domain-containing sensor histidine kinase, partial [Flavobacterium sp.]
YAFSAIKDEVAIVDLNDVLADVQEDLELLIKDRQAKILSVPLPKIQGSKVQMRQLFANLITNAIKYSREDVEPQISIGYELVEEKDGQGKKIQFHKITLTDNGIGMEKSHLSKIFTIFQRLHLRTEYSGNGIGLAICKKIMENHSGKIEVQSETGIGSSFSLYFPTIIK